MALSLSYKIWISGSNIETIKIWNLISTAEIRKFTGHNDWVKEVAFSPNGKALALINELKGNIDYVISVTFRHIIKIWKLKTGAQKKRV